MYMENLKAIKGTSPTGNSKIRCFYCFLADCQTIYDIIIYFISTFYNIGIIILVVIILIFHNIIQSIWLYYDCNS